MFASSLIYVPITGSSFGILQERDAAPFINQKEPEIFVGRSVIGILCETKGTADIFAGAGAA